MSDKRITPYERLRQSAHDFACKVKYPRRCQMWLYPKDKLTESWSLHKLAERVAAAHQLGHDVMLSVSETGDLVVEYVEKRPDTPWQFRE